MQDETKPGTESRKHASSVTKQATDLPEERANNTLTLTPGDLLTGLGVFQIDQPHQQTLAHLAVVTAREGGSEEGIRSSAIFHGTDGSDVAIFTQWMNRGAYDQAPQTLMKPLEQDLYQYDSYLTNFCWRASCHPVSYRQTIRTVNHAEMFS